MRTTQEPRLEITPSSLTETFEQKYRRKGRLGSGPARRLRWGYFSPEEHYETLVNQLVTGETRWLDVGCGRAVFPSNPTLSKELSQRCTMLVGVDPDQTINENPYLHKRVLGSVDDVVGDGPFSLVTMRMVAEHVAQPEALLDTLARLTEENGLVVVYTIYRYSPVPLITHITPFSLHHPAKRILWRTQAKDTFPTAYRMNTRRELQSLFSAAGFTEKAFWHLDDCRTFQRWPLTSSIELALWSALKRIGAGYPEKCLLGVYGRQP